MDKPGVSWHVDFVHRLIEYVDMSITATIYLHEQLSEKIHVLSMRRMWYQYFSEIQSTDL